MNRIMTWAMALSAAVVFQVAGTLRASSVGSATLPIGGVSQGPIGGADPSFFISFSDGGTLNGSGTLTATSNGPGSYTVDSGTITVSGSPSTHNGLFTIVPDLSAPTPVTSPQGSFNYDNQLFPAQDPSVDFWGLLFSNGATEVNIYSTGPGAYLYADATGPGNYGLGNGVPITFTVTEVPLPGSAKGGMLLLGGLGVLQGFKRLRRQVA